MFSRLRFYRRVITRTIFSMKMLFRVQVFPGPGLSWSRFFRVQVFQGPAPSFISSLALHIQLVHAFVEQMPLNTIFSLKPFENGIN